MVAQSSWLLGSHAPVELDLVADLGGIGDALDEDHLLHLVAQGLVVLEFEDEHVADVDPALGPDRHDAGAFGGAALGVAAGGRW